MQNVIPLKSVCPKNDDILLLLFQYFLITKLDYDLFHYVILKNLDVFQNQVVHT